MLRFLAPNLEVTIQPNHIAVRNVDSGQFAATAAPFSCGHLIVDDVDILEHAANQLFKRTVVPFFWSFPRVQVSIAGRAAHGVERKAISDALLNAGASKVAFYEGIETCDEQSEAQSSYVEMANRKR